MSGWFLGTEYQSIGNLHYFVPCVHSKLVVIVCGSYIYISLAQVCIYGDVVCIVPPVWSVSTCVYM